MTRIEVLKENLTNLALSPESIEAFEIIIEAIEQLEDKKLHENEFGFDMLCEKYVDDCAMRIFQSMISSEYFSFKSDAINIDISISYDIAELMLKEKLKRKNDR